MQSFLLVACMVTFVTSASALLNFNCAMECRENSDCKTRVGPCNTCKAITGGDDMKCVPPSWETPKPCGTDCSSEDECQTEGRINPCPSCQPRRDGEGSACVQNLILKAKCFTPCESDEDCEPEGSCPSCSGGFASGKKCLSKPRL